MDLWIIKFFFVSIATLAVWIFAISNWYQNKKILIFFLIFLFAQTGFCYEISRGIFTSVAELLFYSLIIAMTFSGSNSGILVISNPILRPFLAYTTISIVGVLTALFHEVDYINILAEFKTYYLYTLYIFVIPFMIKNKREIVQTLWCMAVFGLIPFFYMLISLSDRSAIRGAERLNLSSEWGALNILVGFILPLSFLIIGLLFSSRSKILKGIFSIYFMACLMVLFFSQTRSGWAAFLIGALFLCYSYKLRWKMIGLIVLATIILSIFSQFDIVNSIIEKRVYKQTIEQQDSALSKRFQRWDTAWENFKNFPVLGTGWGGFFVPKNDGSISENPIPILPLWHNSFFEILSQIGLIGAIAYYYLWYSIFKIGFKAIRNIKNKADLHILGGLIASSVSSFIYSFGEQQFYKIETASVAWCITALMVTYSYYLYVGAIHKKIIFENLKGGFNLEFLKKNRPDYGSSS